MTGSAHEPCTVTLFRSSKQDCELRRVRGEFRAMPGMKLTIEQAVQRWSIDRQTCSEMFDSLVAAGFLQRDAYGRYHKAHTAA